MSCLVVILEILGLKFTDTIFAGLYEILLKSSLKRTPLLEITKLMIKSILALFVRSAKPLSPTTLVKIKCETILKTSLFFFHPSIQQFVVEPAQ